MLLSERICRQKTVSQDPNVTTLTLRSVELGAGGGLVG
jgi:hypothetical protein